MSAARRKSGSADSNRPGECQAVVELLSCPEAYPDRPGEVRLIETHISWVFVTDRFVYKLKKPVRYDFLDFSTRSLRHEACRQEVLLNRRLSPDVYLNVVPITEDDQGRLQLDGAGTAVDWVVSMRRLPAERALDQLIRSGRLIESDLRQLAVKLAEFYAGLPPAAVEPDVYRRLMENHIQGNRRELMNSVHGLAPVMVKRIHAAQLRLLRLAPELLDDRVRQGRIVEGHGDLRPEHIYFIPSPTIIDCIEFNAELRRLDVLDELSFLAMECAALDAEWVGERIIEQYCRASGDEAPSTVVNFYKSYRACVRAKVLALRATQLSAERHAMLAGAQQYLLLADGYASRLGPPLVLVVRGLMGVGKSTIAAALAESLAAELLQTDAVRQEIFGAGDGPADYNHGRYREENRAKVYEEMFRRAAKLLDNGLSVVLDGAFLSTALRSQAVSLANRYGAKLLLAHCRCPDEVAVQRIAARREAGESLSEARPELYPLQRQDEEADPPGAAACEADTTRSVSEVVEAIVSQLGKKLG